ncbi:MAG: hypothetical protein LBS60_06410 [Deltaproteobacteria bacterium]|jgi:hypothetical protein|nr:hypothetical protein [Deltaproteobacteria bacterium]
MQASDVIFDHLIEDSVDNDDNLKMFLDLYDNYYSYYRSLCCEFHDKVLFNSAKNIITDYNNKNSKNLTIFNLDNHGDPYPQWRQFYIKDENSWLKDIFISLLSDKYDFKSMYYTIQLGPNLQLTEEGQSFLRDNSPLLYPNVSAKFANYVFTNKPQSFWDASIRLAIIKDVATFRKTQNVDNCDGCKIYTSIIPVILDLIYKLVEDKTKYIIENPESAS